jgi:zinc/manganese transport system substrate-binding protein
VAASTTKITAIGAENEYADVISQIGGKWVQATSIMSNPNTDPHTFEASPAVARQITAAKLVVVNVSSTPRTRPTTKRTRPRSPAA